YDRQRPPRGQRQHARHALPSLGDEQVSEHGILARAGGDDGHRGAREDHQPARQARHARAGRARRRVHARARRRAGGVRRYAQEHAQGRQISEAGRNGARGEAFRPTLPDALQLPVGLRFSSAGLIASKRKRPARYTVTRRALHASASFGRSTATAVTRATTRYGLARSQPAQAMPRSATLSTLPHARSSSASAVRWAPASAI